MKRDAGRGLVFPVPMVVGMHPLLGVLVMFWAFMMMVLSVRVVVFVPRATSRRMSMGVPMDVLFACVPSLVQFVGPVVTSLHNFIFRFKIQVPELVVSPCFSRKEKQNTEGRCPTESEARLGNLGFDHFFDAFLRVVGLFRSIDAISATTHSAHVPERQSSPRCTTHER